jgi:hypothetical protein
LPICIWKQWADSPYSIIHSYIWKGDLAITADGAAYTYVTRCAPLEVIPRSHRNCTEEISALHNRL